ncbi:MAG: glycosyltransferase family 2 protein [Ruminococcaceae bacterium]|nr:glycosyltransferase family 2 protein [Oscillospiraceae bacterium]
MKTYISIITPCYNGENYIETAIESVLSQSCIDLIELIIIDDGSTDATGKKCKNYISDTVKYYYTENKGAGHARNLGISKAQGVWTMFLDADDMLLKNSIDEDFINKLRLYEQQEKDVIYGAKIKCDMKLEDYYEIWFPETEEEVQHIPRLEFWTNIFRTKYLNDNNIRFFEYREQDIESAFRYRVREYSPNTATDKDVFFILQRENMFSNTHTWKEDVMHLIKAVVYMELFRENTNEQENEWLVLTALEETFKFYESCIELKSVKKEDKKTIDKLFAELFKKAKSKGNSNAKNIQTKMKSLKRKLWFVRHNLNKKAEANHGIKSSSITIDMNTFYYHWEKISEYVKSGYLTGNGSLQVLFNPENT